MFPGTRNLVLSSKCREVSSSALGIRFSANTASWFCNNMDPILQVVYFPEKKYVPLISFIVALLPKELCVHYLLWSRYYNCPVLEVRK